MDKTNRALKISRRMTEIEELKANADLSQQAADELTVEYDILDEELNSLEVASDPKL
jgi:hypothetical protein